jgi:hypothetical protein
MKKIFIKYNPYKLETEIKVDGFELAENSVLLAKSTKGNRIQEWVEELPTILREELNDNDFEVMFHGTILDYEDLSEALTQASELGILTFKLHHQPAKETSDKEDLLENLFNEIKSGPIAELRSDKIIDAFQTAKNKDFNVCVVATMSAGKSTLLNALLGTKLLPAKQEACTAIITRIKDISIKDETPDDLPFRAEIYDQDGNLIETHDTISLGILEKYNFKCLNYNPKNVILANVCI